MAGEPQVVSEVEPIFNKYPNPPDPFISYLTAGSLGKVGVADLNGDSKKDILVTGAYLGGQQVDNNKLTLLFNQTGTILQQPRSEVVTLPRPFALAMADFNKDGKTDIALPAAALDGPGKLGFHLDPGVRSVPEAGGASGARGDPEVIPLPAA